MLSVFFLVISIVTTAFVFADFITAMINTAFFVFIFLIWFNFIFKLYNRFKIPSYSIESVTSNEVNGDSGIVTKNPLQVKCNINYEGYLTKRGIKKALMVFEPYARRYFVLIGCNLWYYKNKKDYLDDASATAIKTKPIRVELYDIIAESTAIEFKITLRPCKLRGLDDMREWVLFCETEDEFNEWQKAISSAILLHRQSEDKDKDKSTLDKTTGVKTNKDTYVVI